MDEAQFLHANTYSGKLKVTFIELLGQHDQIWVWPFGSWDYVICCISRMNELSYFFVCSFIVSEKLKVTLGMHTVKYGCDLSGPETLKICLSQEQIDELS